MIVEKNKIAASPPSTHNQNSTVPEIGRESV
jgi:hypothetical protein